MVGHHHFDECRVDSQAERDNLVPDALSHRHELITLRFLIIVDEIENNFLEDVRKMLKHDKVAVIINRFFGKRGLKKTSPESRRMKNLRRNNGLHYFKQTRLYVPAEELRKRLLHEFHDTL